MTAPTDREKRLEEAAREIASGTAHGFPDDGEFVFCPDCDVMAAGILPILRRIDSDARREEREADCRAVCVDCRSGNKPQCGLGNQYWHGYEATGGDSCVCPASPIRARHPEARPAEEIPRQTTEPCPPEPHLHGDIFHHPWDVEPKDSEGER